MLALNGVLMLVYAILGRLTFAASVEYGNVTSVVFAPEGVALAFCILWGPRMAIGIVLGQALLSYWSGPSLLGGLVIGLVNAAEGVLGAYLFQRWGLSRQFNRLRDVLTFVALVFGILQPISATGGTLVLLVSGMAPADLWTWLGDAVWVHGVQKPLLSLDLLPAAWLHWWLGNSLGQMLFAPLVLAWHAPQVGRKAVRLLDGVLLAAGAAAVVGLLVSEWRESAMLLLALSYLFFLWIGSRFDLRVVTLANVALTLAALVLGVHGTGFMQHLSSPDRVLFVSLVVALVLLSSLTLFALLAERSAMIEELRALASTDALTRVGNRRHFMAQGRIAAAQAQRRGLPLCVAMLDVDHFKQVNDRHGHAAGDLVLQMLAYHCRVTLRASDLVGRVGGEEFALLLADADDATAGAIVQRLLARVRTESVRAPDGTALSVTFSAGVARMEPGEPLESLLDRADKAMYRAKQSGRNCVCMHAAQELPAGL